MVKSTGTLINVKRPLRLNYATIQELIIQVEDTREKLTFVIVDQSLLFAEIGDTVLFEWSPRYLLRQKHDGVMYYALQIHKIEPINRTITDIKTVPFENLKFDFDENL